ncbi:Nudix family hydrolase [Frateuria aurantia]
MHVVAAILKNAGGQLLLAQRPPGKHLAGLWEFAGGKLEPGEGRLQGLQREIAEELGITVQQAHPWMWLPWTYGDRSLQLDVWMVSTWDGEPHGREGQAIAWVDPAEVDLASLAGADRMILRSLRLPVHYPITAPDLHPSAAVRVKLQLEEWLAAGHRMLQLRLPLWSSGQVRALAASLLPKARAAGAQLILSGDVEGARQLGAGVGVQLPAAEMLAWRERPLPLSQYVGGSCHDAAQLAMAVQLDLDFVTLSPVLATTSHPGAPGMGWSHFAELVATSSVPVYGLGGLGSADLVRLRELGAQGIAGIREFQDGAFSGNAR